MPASLVLVEKLFPLPGPVPPKSSGFSELLIDRAPNPTDVEADIGTRPIIVDHRGGRRCLVRHVRRHRRACDHRRKRHASRQELFPELGPPSRLSVH